MDRIIKSNIKYQISNIFLFLIFNIAIATRYKEAQELFAKGIYQEAINILEDEISKNPKNLEARLLLGKSYKEIGDLKRAIEEFEIVLQAKPGDSIPLEAELQELKRQYQTELRFQIQEYKRILDRYPNNQEYLEKLATREEELSRFVAATSQSQQTQFSVGATSQSRKGERGKMKEKSEKGAADILSQARKASWQEDFSRAESLYKIYLVKKPNDKTALLEYAQILSWAGQFHQSIETYKNLLVLDPGNQKVRKGLAEVYSWAGEYDSSLKYYKTLDTLDKTVLKSIGRVYRWADEKDRALNTYQKILKLDPNDEETKRSVALLKAEIGNRKTENRNLFFNPNFSGLWDTENFNLFKATFPIRIPLNVNTEIEPSHEVRRITQKGDTIQGFSYRLTLEQKFHKRLKGSIFYAFNQYDLVNNFYSYGVDFAYQPISPETDGELALIFSYRHHELVYDVFTTRSLIQGIETDGFRFQFLGQMAKGYGVESNIRYGILSDENRFFAPDFSLFFQVFPRLKIGYKYSLISYKDTSHYYWSPDFYQTHSVYITLDNSLRDRLYYWIRGEMGKVHNIPRVVRSLQLSVTYTPARNVFLGGDFSFATAARFLDLPVYQYKSVAIFLKVGL